ncbi:MAG: esterase family protein [Saprospiraceae bacterium]|nr:esterase family protein [Saprospiraceae bacterium]MBP7679466.1 esterase family protein [Saprospiraceae bacterium]
MQTFLNRVIRWAQSTTVERRDYYSNTLQRNVVVDIFLPPYFRLFFWKKYPFLILNDGQDTEALAVAATLEDLYANEQISPIVVAAVHTAADRLQEYGVAHQPDYAGRGKKAAAYTDFITKQLLPQLKKDFRTRASGAIAGCSLGGLSAFDIAWHQSHYFYAVGVFSGSFWWRSAPFSTYDPDADRMVHTFVEQQQLPPALQKIWLQTGTHDETSDRNNNGIIDSIDDTLDLLKLLHQKGYNNEHLHYVEVEGGEHNPLTWAKVLPDFLKFVFG